MLGVRRVGHGGTLDPAASGVLPILVGAATRFSARLHEASKVYDATVRFGIETTTDDREGAVVRETPAPVLDGATIERGLSGLRGVITQLPPAYSALKIAGRPAYARARAGEEVTLRAREVQVHRLDVIAVQSADVRLLVVCSAGTYVRAIARDLGRALGSAAHLRALRRLAVGALDVRDAPTIDELRALGRDAVVRRLRAADASLLTLDRQYLERPATIVAGESRT